MDGRRVFKTKDGQRVFDEHGQELAKEVIDPRSIDDKKPKWEDFHAGQNEFEKLAEEREQLNNYQQKLDDARERVNKGDISERELKEIKADLKAEMPDAVRQKLEQDEDKPKAVAERKLDNPVAALAPQWTP